MEIKQNKIPSIDIKSSTNIKFIVCKEVVLMNIAEIFLTSQLLGKEFLYSYQVIY
jgi:hypothetical protein